MLPHKVRGSAVQQRQAKHQPDTFHCLKSRLVLFILRELLIEMFTLRRRNMSSSISQKGIYDKKQNKKRTLLMFSLLNKNYYWNKGILTQQLLQKRRKSLSEVFHAYGAHTSRQKSKFQAFITKLASANKVLMGKPGWTAVAREAILEKKQSNVVPEEQVN